MMINGSPFRSVVSRTSFYVGMEFRYPIFHYYYYFNIVFISIPSDGNLCMYVFMLGRREIGGGGNGLGGGGGGIFAR